MAMNRGSMRQQITKGPMKKKVGLYSKGKRVRIIQGNKGRIAKNNIRTR
jgi:citrate lyase alpha subunit|tara:strand:- start:228 stop:374 length:147 start_codon:yes stop_codon:yes gene_type:complete